MVSESIADPEADPTPGFPSGVMPQNYGDDLTPEEIEALANYILTGETEVPAEGQAGAQDAQAGAQGSGG